MEIVDNLRRLVSRFRYPVSLPEDLARDLGVRLSNEVSFSQLIRVLRSPDFRCVRLKRWMHRDQAEALFRSALKKESFKMTSLFSYYFNKGWLVLTLHFDEKGCLRRVHVECPCRAEMEGFDLPLSIR